MTEAEIERASVEAVFCLGGGELMDVPWKCTHPGDGVEVAWPHWYEGIPDASYRTLIPAANPYSGPPEELKDSQGTWKLVQTFASSGETKCVYLGGDDGDTVLADQLQDGECPFCGESTGSEHGFIYLGEGSCEAVYKLEGGENDG